MSRLKDETLSIRTSAEIKQLLRLAADRERRSVASMIEILVLEYARTHDLKPDPQGLLTCPRQPYHGKREKSVNPGE
ncbi:MAG: hypothetical protein HZY78_03320 [Burkholderiaceae bacterium]|nr:MAG: hypothetical protein HZY78_03320 [Burkholderiaceae bacterium]